MKKLLSVCVLAMAVMGCSSDGDSNPFGPSNPLMLSGRWSFSAQLASNTCPFSIPNAFFWNGEIVQDGNGLTVIADDMELDTQTGTVNTATGDYIADPVVVNDRTGTVTLTETGVFSSNTQYSGSQTLTVQDGGASCQVVYNVQMTR